MSLQRPSVPQQSVPPSGHRRIPLFDTAGESSRLGARLEARLSRVLRHGRFILGPEVTEFEEALAGLAGVAHVIGVSSGREALTMALMALDVAPGDAVFVPAFTFAATASAVVMAGATPVFVDVDPVTGNMCPEQLERAIETTAAETDLHPRVVMPVDLYGLPADYDAIHALARKFGLTVVADAAQSFGASVGDRHVGALAPVSAISFYPTKPLGAFGDGGAVLTYDDNVAAAVRQIRDHGRDGSGTESVRLGLTGRLDTLQAAVLLAKLEVFQEDLAVRREIADRYSQALEGTVLRTPPRPAGVNSAWALYTLRLDRRDAVREELAQAGIDASVYYALPLPRHPAFAQWAGDRAYPASDRLATEVLSLPIHPGLSLEDVDYVSQRLLQALS